MAIDESREERLARLEQRIAAREQPAIASAEELGRSETARAAWHFGFDAPAFRTSVKLRFFGEGVEGNDLRGSIAGALIGGVSEVVDAAGKSVRMPRESAALYLSPVVTPGSTIVELFGPAPGKLAQDKLDSEIDDSPMDSIMQYVFALLNAVNSVPLEQLVGADLEISTQLGRKLFTLSKDLIDTQVDMSIIWTRPRGTSRTEDFTRTTASGFRALLDVEKVETVSRTEQGTLKQISTEGKIGFEYQEKTKPRSITLDNEAVGDDQLRGLWAREVRLSWTEQTTSHPRRSSTSVVRTVTGVERVEQAEPGGTAN
jgi:hypothetical protein